MSVRLIYPEARAAMAEAQRLGRLTARQLRDAVTEFDSLFEEIDLVEVDELLARRAGELAEVRHLRGYDAVHLAAADRVRDPDVVVVAGDGALLAAATAEGFSIAGLSSTRQLRFELAGHQQLPDRAQRLNRDISG